jgi:predicted DNA-binding ribbon-helix-helix protein
VSDGGLPVVKRSVRVAGHRTSVSVEEPFWDGLRDIARQRGLSLNRLVASIDAERKGQNLSSAIRVAVLSHYRQLAEAHGAEG